MQEMDVVKTSAKPHFKKRDHRPWSPAVLDRPFAAPLEKPNPQLSIGGFFSLKIIPSIQNKKTPLNAQYWADKHKSSATQTLSVR